MEVGSERERNKHIDDVAGQATSAIRFGRYQQSANFYCLFCFHRFSREEEIFNVM